MSWLWGPADPTAPTFHPVSSRFQGTEIYGELGPKDTEWTCAGGFVTETQSWYNFLQDGTLLICQVIHSSVGLWYPQVQFTFKTYNPTTKEKVWRSANVTNFITPAPGLDKRSCKADQFTVTLKSKPGTDTPEAYIISANISADVQISLEISRPKSAPGWKIGNGPKSGFSYYGADPEKADGYMIHRFWPRTNVSGHIIYKGQAIEANGPGMFVHVVMGMRPNLVAARWNFANFQSEAHGGVSAIQMEYTTQDAYGRKGAGSGGVKVNVGSVVVAGKLVSVCAETTWPDEPQDANAPVKARAFHYNLVDDPETSYGIPKQLEFVWAGPSIAPDVSGQIAATLKVDVGEPSAPKGLVEKVDVLAEIPAMVKSVISYVAGTKPYVYQWYNAASLMLTAPEDVLPGASEGLAIEGTFYNEATYIS